MQWLAENIPQWQNQLYAKLAGPIHHKPAVLFCLLPFLFSFSNTVPPFLYLSLPSFLQILSFHPLPLFLSFPFFIIIFVFLLYIIYLWPLTSYWKAQIYALFSSPLRFSSALLRGKQAH
jgi:hypothetical protein